ncbi:MAG: sigma-54 dependent transcriptional regulator [bacterium]
MAEPARILIVDDEPETINLLKTLLVSLRAEMDEANSGEEALPMVRSGRYNLLITDLKMGGMDGIELMREALRIDPNLIVIMMTGFATIASAVEAMREGAYHFLTKPFTPREVQIFVEKGLAQSRLLTENREMRKQLQEVFGLEQIIGKSKTMEDLFALVRRVADSDSTVLIQGESGTGKELVAQAIHSLSARAHERLVKVNCHALAANILESELFGHTRGAFTGATQDRRGLFAMAHRGTILLDEIGSVSQELQAKLLRTLEIGEIRPVGGDTTYTIDARVIASTNQDLPQEVEEGNFREDLYYRLNVITLTVPPLRQHKEDIPLLVKHFVEQLCKGKNLPKCEPGFLECLVQYFWPGNVRQLRSAIERAYLLREQNILLRAGLPPEILVPERMEMDFSIGQVLPLSLEEGERRQIEKALATTNGHLTRAADLLGISRRTLYTKIRKYEIDSKNL